MLRRSLTAAGLMLAGSLILAGSPARAAEPTIALVTINQQALFFNQMNDGAKEAAKEAGVKLVIFNANNDPAAQNNAIENYITQKVDGIIVVAIDVNGVMPAVEAAAKRRHPGRRRRRASCPRDRKGARSASTTRRAGEQIGKYFADYVEATWAARPRSASSARSTPSSRTSA